MKLGVYFEARLTGEIEQMKSGSMEFKYDPAWLGDKESFALSYSLPKQDKVFSTEADSFFGNYLPEGPVRQAICEIQGISIDNDFALLKKIGGECAGALVISESTPEIDKNRYQELLPSRLAEFSSRDAVYASLTEIENMRLSLAGAQDKLPIYLAEDKKILLPLGTAPSTHILKFANSRFKGLVLNEYYTMSLASQLGLNTVEIDLMPVEKEYFLVVKRYDRLRTEPPNLQVKRLHQEDLCQALGVSHKNKYEKEEGPSFARAYALVTNASDSPLVDNEKLIRWQITNLFIGNCDGHAKNISFLRSSEGRWRLSPFYDLVCTIAYPQLSKDLAMGVGGVNAIGTLTPVHWKRMAESIGVHSKTIETMLLKTLETFPMALKLTHEKITKQYGEQPIFDRLHQALEKNYKIILKRCQINLK